jgi:hypothetical protein
VRKKKSRWDKFRREIAVETRSLRQLLFFVKEWLGVRKAKNLSLVDFPDEVKLLGCSNAFHRCRKDRME